MRNKIAEQRVLGPARVLNQLCTADPEGSGQHHYREMMGRANIPEVVVIGW